MRLTGRWWLRADRLRPRCMRRLRAVRLYPMWSMDKRRLRAGRLCPLARWLQSPMDTRRLRAARHPLSAITVDPLTDLVDETLASGRKRQVSSETSSCVERCFRRSLSQEQQAALRRAYPCPDVPACVPPSLGQSLGEVVDTSRHVDDQLYQIQTHLLRTAGPLVVLLDGLEGEVASEPDAVVPCRRRPRCGQGRPSLLGHNEQFRVRTAALRAYTADRSLTGFPRRGRISGRWRRSVRSTADRAPHKAC